MTALIDTAAPREVIDSPIAGTPPSGVARRVMAGAMLARSVYAVCKLGIPDLCAENSRSVAELAAASGADADALARFVRLLAGAGFFEEDATGRIHLTPAGALLCEGTVGSIRPLVLVAGEVLEVDSAATLYALRTGKPAFDHAHGCSAYDHLAAHPEAEALFAKAMTNRAAILHDAVLDAVDWSDVRHIVDVGGNRGGFLATVLQRMPGTTGVLFDQPQVVAGARAELESAGVADRVDVEGGDFFVSVPAGGDLYLLANVLWNWDDQRANSILRRCRDAMASGARLAICEPIVPSGNEPHPAKNMDLVNFLVFGGRTRTATEWDALLRSAGFVIAAITETASDWSVIEAVPASS